VNGWPGLFGVFCCFPFFGGKRVQFFNFFFFWGKQSPNKSGRQTGGPGARPNGGENKGVCDMAEPNLKKKNNNGGGGKGGEKKPGGQQNRDGRLRRRERGRTSLNQKGRKSKDVGFADGQRSFISEKRELKKGKNGSRLRGEGGKGEVSGRVLALGKNCR